ncbi:MAG: integration host factor subunit beta [Deltaproteobacteria bacterium]|nr:integration host factor subunit beta [Deltaproteobacteria bacterium]
MTKADLIDVVAARTKVTRDRAALVVNTVFEQIMEAMKKSERVEIRNFGNFTIRKYGSYTGRNPKTGEKVHVSPKRMPFFKVGLELKQLANQRLK